MQADHCLCLSLCLCVRLLHAFFPLFILTRSFARHIEFCLWTKISSAKLLHHERVTLTAVNFLLLCNIVNKAQRAGDAHVPLTCSLCATLYQFFSDANLRLPVVVLIVIIAWSGACFACLHIFTYSGDHASCCSNQSSNIGWDWSYSFYAWLWRRFGFCSQSYLMLRVCCLLRFEAQSNKVG